MNKKQAIQKSKKIFQKEYKKKEDLSNIDDEWFSVSDNWDLNIWYDEDEQLIHYTLYPVIKETTLGEHPMPIDEYFEDVSFGE